MLEVLWGAALMLLISADASDIALQAFRGCVRVPKGFYSHVIIFG
jgi:hypothetical protein